MDDKIKRFLSRFQDAWCLSERMSSKLRDAYKYALPQQNIHEYRDEGEKKGGDVFTAILTDALNGFVGKMVSGLTPKGVEWLKLTAGPEIPEEQHENVNRMLEDDTKAFFKFLDRSNFYSAITQCYKDWAIGTAALVCNEKDDDDNPLQFSHVSIDTLAFEKGPYGDIKSVFRKFDCFYIRNIEAQWPRAVISDTMRIQLEGDDNATTNLKEGVIYDPKTKLYNYLLTTEDGNHVLLDEYSPSSQWVVFRYSTYNDDVFGSGPVLDLLPEIQTFNNMRRDFLANNELSLNPPILAFGDSIVNAHNIRYTPGAIIPVEPLINGNPSLQQFQTNSNFQIAQFEMENIAALIRKALFVDPIGPIDSKSMTATEVTVRVREITEKIGPALGLFYSEGANSAVDRITFILRKRGLMNNIIVDNKLVSIKYNSPLSLSQGMSEVSQFEQMNAMMVQTLGPQSVAAYKVDMLPMWLAERFGVDPNIINSQFEMQQVAQAATELVQPESFQSVRGAA